MGIYTNAYTARGSYAGHYTDVEPFVGESFNYHELGIIAASEITANNNAFMKSIALAELTAMEQYGNTDVLYEGIDFSGIWEKIKMFFKKIIDKIHKIFHTFIAKMSSWFGNNKSFAKTYAKEVIKGWANVKNDWDYKGYNFKTAYALAFTASSAKALKADFKSSGTNNSQTTKDVIASFMNDGSLENFIAIMDKGNRFLGNAKTANQGAYDKDTGQRATNNNTNSGNADLKEGTELEKAMSDLREKLPDIKDGIRQQFIDGLKAQTPKFETEIDFGKTTGLDQSDFTKELYEVLRDGEDSKTSLEKKDIEASYGGSISNMMKFIEDFETVKKALSSAEKAITDNIDDLIKRVNKAQDKEIKEKTNKDVIIQISSLFQSLWGAASETAVQVFSALLQAQKEACTQAKEIAVKVIGQSKKMTEESYDYSNSYSSNNNGYDFISSVKLI